MKSKTKEKILYKPYFCWPKPSEYLEDYEEIDRLECEYEQYKIPEGTTHISLDIHYDYNSDDRNPVVIFYKDGGKRRNPNYDKELEQYNKKYSEYKEELKAYNKQERERKKQEKAQKEQSEKEMYEILKAKYENAKS